MLVKRQTPTEFLVRFEEGENKVQVKAAHVRYLTKIVEIDENTGEETLLTSFPENAQPVAVGKDDPGFPLADVLSQVQINLLIDNADKTAELSGLEQKHEAALESKATEIAQLKKELKEGRDKIKNVTPPKGN